MILADTSVWVDHLNRTDMMLADLLGRELVVAHAFVIGEVSPGHLRQRQAVIKAFRELQQVMHQR